MYQPRLKEKATLLLRCSAHNDGEFVTFIITPELIEKVFFSYKAKRVRDPFVVIMKLEHAVTSNNRITPFASLETTSETRANPIQLSRWFPLQLIFLSKQIN